MSGPAATPAAPPRRRRRPSAALLVQQRLQQLVALAVRVGRVLGQLLARRRDRVVLGALAAAHDLATAPPTSISASSRWQLFRQSRSPHWNSRRPATRASSTRARSIAGGGGRAAPRSRAAGERPRGQQRDPDGAHGAGVGRHDDLALEHGGERARQRRVGRRLALEEDPVEQPPLAHDAAAVVAHHRVLQPGEDVVAAEAVAERLGGHVGDEDGARLAEVRRPVAAAASRPNSAMSSTPWAIACSSRNEPVPALHTRFMSASTTRPFSTLMNLASWPPISTMERLRPPSGSSARGGRGVRDDLVLDDEPLRRARGRRRGRRSPRRRGRSR